MPELPEVVALTEFLRETCTGQTVARTELATFACLKTYDPPLAALAGLEVEAVERRGKFIGLSLARMWLVFHLARAGWLTWRKSMPAALVKPGRGPLALRVVFDDETGFDLTEAGTKKRLAVYLTSALDEIPGIAVLGPDPLAADFDLERLVTILTAAGGAQLKGVLRDQRKIAGIGNAYSDEILHAAKLSPFRPSNGLKPEEQQFLFSAIRSELGRAIAKASGLAASELKDSKRSSLRVHGRTGQPCSTCGVTIAEVAFADSSLQYCPGCQTGGKLLADRRMSRLLK